MGWLKNFLSSNQGDLNRVVTRRTFIISGAQVTLWTALVGKLAHLQLINYYKYLSLSNDNRLQILIVLPERGTIYDKTGVPITINERNFQILILGNKRSDKEEINKSIDAVAKYVPITDEQRYLFFKKLSRTSIVSPIMLRNRLTPKEIVVLSAKSYDMSGVIVDYSMERDYPFHNSMSHILGYVAPPRDKEIEKSNDPAMRYPGYKIGKDGIEYFYNQYLSGKYGTREIEVNARGKLIRELSIKKGSVGSDIILSIDNRIQQYANKLIKPYRSGAVVLMDITNGQLLTLLSFPHFDNNVFSYGVSSKQWRSMIDDPLAQLVNKSISGQYAPASTFKVMTALAALEHGIITVNELFSCEGSFEHQDQTFHCWRKKGHGELNITNAISASCDVFFYKLALKLGIDKLADVASRFGIGAKTGIDIPGEVSGVLPTPELSKRLYDTSWSDGQTILTAIGQGWLLTTPLQMALVTACIANGGKKITPTLLHSISNVDNNKELVKLPEINISKSALTIVRKGLFNAVNRRGGTARSASLRNTKVYMAGKTGTAQVRNISAQEREEGIKKDKDLDWLMRDNSLFIGYAPFDKPKYAISVIAEHGGWGSVAAAPIAGRVMRYALKLLKEQEQS